VKLRYSLMEWRSYQYHNNLRIYWKVIAKRGQCTIILFRLSEEGELKMKSDDCQWQWNVLKYFHENRPNLFGNVYVTCTQITASLKSRILQLTPWTQVHMMRLNDTLFEVLKNQFKLVLPSTRHIKHSSLYSTPVPLCITAPALTLSKATYFELCNTVKPA